MSECDTKRILVVDDHEDNIELVCQVLEDDGFEFMTARDAATAIEAVERHRPDLAILDVQMPEMDGFGLCRLLCDKFTHDPVPIIFLTAIHRSTEKMVEGLDVGARDYLTKPIEQDALRAKVRAILRAEEDRKRVQGEATRVGRRLAGR